MLTISGRIISTLIYRNYRICFKANPKPVRYQLGDLTGADMDYKVFNDAVHGHMDFHPLLVVVVDTPQMQRLRYVKQLGACSFVYPSALHSRFEHSIGTAFIAGKLFDSLKEKQMPSGVADDILWKKRKLCAQIAGLCHDIGHGPFSHTWESFMKRFMDDWVHEKESVKVFDEVLNEKISPSKKFNGATLDRVRDAFTFYGLNDEDIKDIKHMIRGRKDSNHYLFQIISNKTNGIDVDKWEYLTRDSVMLNIPIGFDFKRLLKYCSVLNNGQGEEEICFREKECPVLLEMFLARGKLHDVAYKHTKVKVIEEMIIDAFVLANDRLKLQKTPVTKLTDHIYQKILYDDFDDDENMKKAQKILNRIEKRHLYKCIAQETFYSECPDENQIKKCLAKIDGIEPYINGITTTTVEVHLTKANKEKALKNVLVYDKFDDHSIIIKMFDWDKYQKCLKPDVENLKRNQVLVLYKNENDFPLSLEKTVRDELKKFLTEFKCDSTGSTLY